MARILIIDDEKAIRNALKDILSYEKYEVHEASDGNEGIKMVEVESYDLVLCDVKMPKADGTEVLSRLQPLRKEPMIIFQNLLI
jgi:DNA-binding response OmpR family regulator